MELKAITGLTQDETAEYNDIWQSLKHRYGSLESARFHFLEKWSKQAGYAHNIHTGTIKPGVEITPLELSMLVDGGYSHFGGQSNIHSDRTFHVKIYTD